MCFAVKTKKMVNIEPVSARDKNVATVPISSRLNIGLLMAVY